MPCAAPSDEDDEDEDDDNRDDDKDHEDDEDYEGRDDTTNVNNEDDEDENDDDCDDDEDDEDYEGHDVTTNGNNSFNDTDIDDGDAGAAELGPNDIKFGVHHTQMYIHPGNMSAKELALLHYQEYCETNSRTLKNACCSSYQTFGK